jgi:phenylalanyl-tRNA synthetase beta chain
MIVSRDWLAQYVKLDMSVEDLTAKLTMSGLNLEGYEAYGSDFAIDLEVTSNRPDCLGHLGIAREIAVLFGRDHCFPNPALKATLPASAAPISVSIEAQADCPRYIARVIKEVKIGPSPAWMQKQLQAVGIACINNVVDITNYVMLEYAQPLHAFDYDRLSGHTIRVRRATQGEKLVAINNKTYDLTPEMCVIADNKQPVAIAGVMGGLATEISDRTTTVLVEAASFAPLSVRSTARKLSLHSPSSYRFERALDPNGPALASLRACQLILELAGGELVEGPVTAGDCVPATPAPIQLRWQAIPRTLGITIPPAEAVRILVALGCQVTTQDERHGVLVPPSFRRDLTREIDLVEEVARVFGYEQIPEDVPVPLCASAKSRRDRVTDKIRQTLVACGYYEALTISFVSEADALACQPFGPHPVLKVDHSTRRQENCLRQSLIPSLLISRRENERHGNHSADLFETAKVFLSADRSSTEDATEPTMLSLVTGQDYQGLKGTLEALVDRICPNAKLTAVSSPAAWFTPGRSAELFLNGAAIGWLGEVSRSVSDGYGLRDICCAAELRVSALDAQANLVPQFTPLPAYPGMSRDINFVLDERVEWESLSHTVQLAAGGLLEGVTFGGQYRGKQIGEGKKSYFFTLEYRAKDRTLTSEEVDESQAAIVAACESAHGAALRCS